MDRFIVASGSFGRGHEFYGPFDSSSEAQDYADCNFFPGTFTVTPLEEPDGLNADHEEWSGPDGRFVLLIGDGFNGHSVVGTFDTSENAFEWEETHDADNQGYHVMWVELRPVEESAGLADSIRRCDMAPR